MQLVYAGDVIINGFGSPHLVGTRVYLNEVCSSKATEVRKVLQMTAYISKYFGPIIQPVNLELTITSPRSIGEYSTPRLVQEKELPPPPPLGPA